MPIIQAKSIGQQFDNGETIFSDLSFALTAKRTGLVGRNGCGKSLLLSLMTQEKSPSSGTLTVHGSIASYSQLPSSLLNSGMTIAEYLGVDLVLKALVEVESGSSDPQWFELAEGNWTLREELSDLLSTLGLPSELNFPCASLSGGQLAKLQLHQLFNLEVDVFLLDEPSNHLDAQGKQWLIEKMRTYDGQILLVSHDRSLLREMEQIWELNTLGLTQYGGNYDFYAEQKQQEVLAVERQVNSVVKQQKQLEVQAQKNREKAEQRASQGKAMRRSGDQPKILLDGMRDSAELSASNRKKNEQGRRELLQNKASALKARQEQLKSQSIYLAGEQGRSKRLVTMLEAVLPYGSDLPINLMVKGGEKLHLRASNGQGKSTLLKVLLGELELKSGQCRINTPVCYLDQHFGLLDLKMSLLETLSLQCKSLNLSEARTLLAGIGFRRDSVHRSVAQLSGGEKMKLAMLVVSHQPTKPLLLLDEPDNHLDLSSKQQLAEALKQYAGSFILVSHDQDFVQESGVSKYVDLI
ncbi:ATP-binding cassette domain-containing protein [Vibrio sp. SCSIO 43136]|uniref:ATP-binding cassette domain-containing protein n=1 Tax=Vibrio sp. SCSIO 43136 TaxID=2819101 RepID=UPI002075D329|nr:ATP-binding cassette domain-containing protein [Vibrio sp. SCSIO 43136]USD67235.1 ABC-F family ATP-binding cassette domain-containing protein [Vibrio sp. SCSIO 43136]